MDEIINQSIDQQQPEIIQESQKEMNFRLLRERAEQERQRADELERRLSEIEQSQRSRYDDDDEIVGTKKVRELLDERDNKFKNTERELQNLKSKMLLETITNIPDYNDVVNEKTLARLQYTDPDLYDSIALQTDEFKKVTAAYKILKRTTQSSNPEYEENSRKMEENKTKPRAGASIHGQVPQSTLGTLGDHERRVLSKEDKKRVLALMEEMKRR